MLKKIILITSVSVLIFGGVFAYLWSEFQRYETVQSSLIERPLPAFEYGNIVTTRPAPTISNTSLKGEVALVNIFGSWCTDCILETDELVALAKQYKLKIYGIATRDTPEDVAKYLRKYGNPYEQIAWDKDNSSADVFGISAVPQSYLIDANGSIRLHFTTPLSTEMIQEQLIPAINILRNEATHKKEAE